MGITKLADLIRIAAPGAISYKDISDYAGNGLLMWFSCEVILVANPG